MDYFWIIIPAAIIIFTLIALLVLKARKKRLLDSNHVAISDSNMLQTENELKQVGIDMDMRIKFEPLAKNNKIDDKRLFEISDSTVIARISQTIPGATQIIASTANKMALNNPNLYSLKIPLGSTLVNKTKTGLQYAFFKGEKSGMAQLLNPNSLKATKVANIANAGAIAMNVASMVVGQYYMTEINSKLETMSNKVDKIGDFQDREFKSRILSVITLVGEISHFSSEIMENNTQRNIKLATLDNLKATATELLGQVNITISDITQKAENLDYNNYQQKVYDFKNLLDFQNTLVVVLEEISKLTYLLGKGSVSTECSYATYNKYIQLCEKTTSQLKQWHDKQVNALQIDLENGLVQKSGIEAVLAEIPSWFDKKHKYKNIREGFINEISTQKQITNKNLCTVNKCYESDVELVIKNGKFYYVKEANKETET